MLLESRVEQKLSGKKISENLNRLHVAKPQQRDTKVRAPYIPAAAALRKKVVQPVKTKGRGMMEDHEIAEDDGEEPKRTLKDLQAELREEYSTDLRAEWKFLKDPSWKYDEIPQIMDGKNVMDFIDPDIMERLEELEREEEAREAAGDYDKVVEAPEKVATRSKAKEIRTKKANLRIESYSKKTGGNHGLVPAQKLNADKRMETKRQLKAAGGGAAASDGMDSHIGGLGLGGAADTEMVEVRGRASKRKRDHSQGGGERDISRGPAGSKSVDPHNRSLTPSRATSGLGSEAQLKRARTLKHQGQRGANALGKIGEADRMYKEKFPKHLHSGKRKGQKTASHR
jgi:nucleolar GTP-binding protein